MLICAHRGYHAEVPENTLAAFERAAEMGVDAIETDVRLSADGQAVLFHDRIGPGGVAVADLTRAELSRQAGYEVPTLEEAVSCWKELLWIVEIKTPAAAEVVIDVVGRLQLTHRFLVISFWHTAIQQVAERLEVDCGLSMSHRPIDPRLLTLESPKFRRPAGALVWNYEFVDAELLETSRGLGFRNFVYGLATPDEHRQCRGLAIDGVITDDPQWLLPGSRSPFGRGSG